MKKFLISIAIVVSVGLLIFFWNSNRTEAPTNGVETGDVGEVAYSNASEDMIVIDAPQAGHTVGSPFIITGKARGNWYFEATFPIDVVDWDGRIIGQGYATAQADRTTGEVNWMTEEFVPFEAEVVVTLPENSYSNRGTLIIKNANASGLPEHDRAVEIPILLSS